MSDEKGQLYTRKIPVKEWREMINYFLDSVYRGRGRSSSNGFSPNLRYLF